MSALEGMFTGGSSTAIAVKPLDGSKYSFRELTHPAPVLAPLAHDLGDVTLGALRIHVLCVRYVPKGERRWERSGTEYASAADEIHIRAEIADRLTGEPIVVTFISDVTEEAESWPMEKRVRSALLQLLAHEVDEQIYKDRVRVFEPHHPEYVMTVTL